MAPPAPHKPLVVFLFAILAVLCPIVSATKEGYVPATVNGQEYLVREDRRPSLYTRNFGDCMGGSLLNVTRFDAACYRDNMTILFHLGGETALKNETIMVYIGVYAYGEARFDLTFNPCTTNIRSACPLQAGVPVEARGIIPISQKDVAGIPPIALSIPDFEGQAILRIFSNSTESEIACYSAVVTNGNSLSQRLWVSSILATFTVIAVLSSFVTAVYGKNVPEMRKHYAHSFSVLVAFAVWQHVYFSGALSMNWPSVLVAFWSNYAWAGGMIYWEVMQNTINNFIGSNKGNISTAGAAGSGVANSSLRGSFDLQSLYKPAELPEDSSVGVLGDQTHAVVRRFEKLLVKRELVDSSSGFPWYGHPVKPGIPLPGSYSGFAGTLAQGSIPASNASMTGFLWFLVSVAGIAVSMMMFKLLIEGMSISRMMKRDRLLYFRQHWLGYTIQAILRTLFIGFSPLIFLSLSQFSYLASTGPAAVACVVFLVVLLGVGGLAGCACFHRIKTGYYASEPDRLNIEKRKALRVIPWYRIVRNSEFPRSEDKKYAGSMPWWRIRPASEEKTIHDDEDYTKKFGWLAARFRKTRWWFFALWLVYEFVRVCFLAGSARSPMVQVLGLLAVEIIAFVGLVILRPFEGQRLNAMVVYLLGFSKVATVALSTTFDTHFALPRIMVTVIGIVIIAIQGLLTMAVLICIMLGAISSYMSVMRNRDKFHPERWIPIREKYLDHLDFKAKDTPRPPKAKQTPSVEPLVEPEKPKEPYFSVTSVRRVAKVEDEDEEFMNEINGNISASQLMLAKHNCESLNGSPGSRHGSSSIRSTTSSSSLPYGARVHRASWSAQDFADPFAPTRPRTLSSPLRTPQNGSRIWSNALYPPINRRN